MGEAVENETLHGLFPVLIQNLPTLSGWRMVPIQTGGTSLTLTDHHVGKSISANLLDADGNAQLAPIQLDGIVSNVNDLPTGGIFIEGELKQGTVAKVNTESLDDEDGLGALSLNGFQMGYSLRMKLHQALN